jgi:EmrB/QacA subfamily drug resistance transporter
MSSVPMTSKQRWILGLTALASCMVALDATVVTTALSLIHRDLSASLASLEWTVNAYSLTFAGLLLTGAALGDRFGRRRMLVVGLAVFTVASAACALATSIGALIAARAVQGVGAALILPLALTQLTTGFPPMKRGRALGLFSGLNGLAVFVGPFVGGAVAQGLAWQWIFWINVPIGAAAIVLVRRRLDESTGPAVRFDLTGVVLGTAGVFAVVWALVRGNGIGWGSAEVVGTLVAGVVLVSAFVWWESRSAYAMLPMRLFRIRAFAAANVANFSLYTSLQGSLFLFTQYLQNGLGYGPFAAGLRIMTWTGTLMVCGPIAGNLIDRYGERRFLVGGLLLNGVGLGGLALTAASGRPYLEMVPALIISGCGLSMAMPAIQKAVVGAVAPAEIGRASGAMNTLRTLGTVFGVAILAAVFAGHGSYASAPAFATGFGAAVAVAAIISVIGAAAGVLVTARAAVPVTPEPAVPVPAGAID